MQDATMPQRVLFLSCFGNNCKIHYKDQFFYITYNSFDGGIDHAQIDHLRNNGFDIEDVHCQLTKNGIYTTITIQEYKFEFYCAECDKVLQKDDAVELDGEVYHRECMWQP